MDIETQVSMDRQLLSQVVRAAYRRTFLRLRVIGVIIVACGAAAVWWDRGPRWVGPAIVAVGLLNLVMPELILAVSNRRLKRVSDQPWTYRITPDDITESTPMFSSTRPWDGVRQVTETDDLWLLRTQLGGIIGLPKRAFSTGQAAELRQILVDRGLAAGRRRAQR
jgi:YcxB-like protein